MGEVPGLLPKPLRAAEVPDGPLTFGTSRMRNALFSRLGNCARVSHDAWMSSGHIRITSEGSKAEFTVAKDQNVRLRSGWFSESDVCYLASGKPVIAQTPVTRRSSPPDWGSTRSRRLEEATEAVAQVTESTTSQLPGCSSALPMTISVAAKSRARCWRTWGWADGEEPDIQRGRLRFRKGRQSWHSQVSCGRCPDQHESRWLRVAKWPTQSQEAEICLPWQLACTGTFG